MNAYEFKKALTSSNFSDVLESVARAADVLKSNEVEEIIESLIATDTLNANKLSIVFNDFNPFYSEFNKAVYTSADRAEFLKAIYPADTQSQTVKAAFQHLYESNDVDPTLAKSISRFADVLDLVDAQYIKKLNIEDIKAICNVLDDTHQSTVDTASLALETKILGGLVSGKFSDKLKSFAVYSSFANASLEAKKPEDIYLEIAEEQNVTILKLQRVIGEAYLDEKAKALTSEQSAFVLERESAFKTDDVDNDKYSFSKRMLRMHLAESLDDEDDDVFSDDDTKKRVRKKRLSI